MSTVKSNRSPFAPAAVLIALLTSGTSMVSVAQTEQLSLPDMGASAETILSRKEEEDYAKALVRQMRAYEVLVEDPLISDFFKDMGFRLASNSLSKTSSALALLNSLASFFSNRPSRIESKTRSEVS